MAWSSGFHGVTPASAIAISHHVTVSPNMPVDSLMVFGCLSTIAAAACYFNRHEGRAAMLTFAGSLAATGVYGFLEGAWPLGMLEIAWAIQAARRALRIRSGRRGRSPFVPDLESRQSRYREIFGSN